MRPTLLLLLLLLPTSTAALAEDDPDQGIILGRKKLPGLRFDLSVEKERFELGEPIEVTMRYSYEGKRRLAVLHVNGDRSGRIVDFGFNAIGDEAAPVRDPLTGFQPGFGGGGRTSGPLESGKPYEQTVPLNEWLCFDRPGAYIVTAWSGIVSLDPHGTEEFYDGPAIRLLSEPLEIVITAPSEESRVERLADARDKLAAEHYDTRAAAARDLRFMVDERAIPLLIPALEDSSGNVAIEAIFGLLAFKDLAPVKKALLAEIEKRYVPPHAFGSFGTLLAAADHRDGPDGERKAWEARFDWIRKLK